MTKLSDRVANTNQINFNELSSTPSTPITGQKRFYAKDDGKVYTLDSTGKEREVGSGSGASKEINQTAHGFAIGDVIYFDGADYVKAQADDEATAEVVGVVSAVAGDDDFTVTSSGYIEAGLSGLTAGSVYYLSASTAGLLTLTEPGVIGHVSKPMLLADSATSGYVLQYRGVLVGAVFNEDTPLNAENLTGTISENALFDVINPKDANGISVKNAAGDTTNVFIKDDGRIGVGTSTPKYGIHNSKPSTVASYDQIRGGVYIKSQQVNAVNNSAVEAFRFLDENGNILATAFVAGHVYVYVTGSSGTNAYSATFLLLTTGNGTAQASFSLIGSQVRGTSPVSSVYIVNDGGVGNVKVIIQYINNAAVVTGGSSHVSFVGQTNV